MKTLKLTTILMLLTFATGQMFSQNVDLGTEKEAVLKVMKTYKDALQNLTTEGTFELFTKDSEVFESGGVEGSYAHYIEHHLGPELGHFKKFEFSDYEGNSRTIKKKGVATSILKKIDGLWKIIKTHSSSRNTK